MVDPRYTSMRLLASGEDIDPYGAEAASFEREYRGGRRVTFISWKLLDKDPRTALAASWYGWTYEEE